MRECIITSDRALRSRAGGRSFSLGEHSDVRLACPRTEEMVLGVIDWIDVERSPRYAKSGNATYCNVAAHDVLRELGTYLPRVWWTNPPAVRFDTTPEYGKNCIEMSANRLVDWMREHGHEFGWRIYGIPPKLRAGDIGVVIGRARKGHGHVQVLYSRAGEQRAMQAGVENFSNRPPYSEEFWSGYADAVWAVQRAGALGGVNVG